MFGRDFDTIEYYDPPYKCLSFHEQCTLKGLGTVIEFLLVSPRWPRREY